MHVPRLFHALCTWWGLPPQARLAWWKAVHQSRCRRVWLWHEAVVQYEKQTVPADFVLRRQYGSPCMVVSVVEDVVREGLLDRAGANRLERHLLAKVDSQGHWAGLPLPELPSELACIVEAYWR